ncbi:sensor histidine kinase [Puia sp.]|uniref:sensor histidine kinase n=1 Tax=Puia sp. TaxID=2045100 RepID=UPI002F3ED71F
MFYANIYLFYYMMWNPVDTGTIAKTVVALLYSTLLYSYWQSTKKLRNSERDLKNIRERLPEEVLRAGLDAQEETFRMVSEEIHDNVGQVLSLAKLHMNFLDREVPECNRERIAEIRKLLNQGLYDLGSMAKALNSSHIDNVSFQFLIENELDRLKRGGFFEIVFEVNGTVYELKRETKMVLFRIVQEALQNIVKHAQASHVRVVLSFSIADLRLKIADNGIGFDPSPTNWAVQNGLGLINIRNRAKLLNASVEFDSTSGAGTAIIICMPIKQTVYEN